MKPKYDLDAIKFSTDGPTWQRAIGLFEKGKVTRFHQEHGGFSAIVIGTSPYHVRVSVEHYDHGSCDCYLGQQDEYCKHMVALAIRATHGNAALSDSDKKFVDQPVWSGRKGTLNQAELIALKGAVTAAMRFIKSYEGPSRTWFAYQNSLDQGCNRLAALVSELPASAQTAKLLVDMLLRLEKKLSFGVDDSNGTVGDCMMGVVAVLTTFGTLDPNCKRAFRALENKRTSFGWEEPLLKLIEDK